MTTSEKIKKIRIEKGFSQNDIAKKLGVSQPSYAQYESGRRRPKLETLRRIATVLQVPLYEIADFSEYSMEEKTKDFFSDRENKTPQKYDIADTIAAHFDGDEFTAEELEDIRAYAEFIKSRRQKKTEK